MVMMVAVMMVVMMMVVMMMCARGGWVGKCIKFKSGW